MKVLCGYIWRKNEQEAEISLADINHSFNGFIEKPPEGYMLDQEGKSLITEWSQSGRILTFTKTYPHSSHRVVHSLRPKDGQWQGLWTNVDTRDEGFIRMWVLEIPAEFAPMRRTVEFVSSVSFRNSLN